MRSGVSTSASARPRQRSKTGGAPAGSSPSAAALGRPPPERDSRLGSEQASREGGAREGEGNGAADPLRKGVVKGPLLQTKPSR